MRVLVAMSGGVDSGVAAARLVDEGHEVIGITFHLWDYPEGEGPGSHGRCCAPEDQYDAKRTADALGFRHFTFDHRAAFLEHVVDPFVAAYGDGLTPSPCSACNRTVKLGQLARLRKLFAADAVATGHYARIARDADGRAFIAEAVDGQKDQSYFLYATPDEMLGHLVFPLGESIKADVRAEALSRRLPGANKGESQELCFVGQGAHAYREFLEQRGVRRRPGRILNGDGEEVGRHEGVHRFTIGQRKGTGVALGKPAFVTRIDAQTGEVEMGDERALYASSASLREAHFTHGITPAADHVLRARVRYRHAGADAQVNLGDVAATAHLKFSSPVRALTRGQVVVFYDGARVVGGGILDRVNACEHAVQDALQVTA
jgi:tRNA-specific 2-thiouridylase